MREIRPTTLATETLRYGQDHAQFPVNARKTDRDVGIAEFEKSLLAEGLLQPLLVWRDTDGDGFDYVVDGSRRLNAIRNLVTNNPGDTSIASHFETVPVMLFEGGSAAEALKKSMAGFLMTLPPHPVDQFEAFAAIVGPHLTSEQREDAIRDVITRYGVSDIVVRRRLAIGGLAPMVREDLRAGKIDMEAAMALTKLTAPNDQEAVYKKLRKTGALSAYSINVAIMGDARDSGKFLKFVTRREYEARGGGVLVDLFTEDGLGDGVTDRPLLVKMVNEKLQAEVAKLLEPAKHNFGQAWSWASIDSDLPEVWSYTWAKLPIDKKNPATPDDKKKSGAVVFVDDNGKLAIIEGVLKPEIGKSPGAKKKAKTEFEGERPFEPALPIAVERALQRQATRGLAQALSTAPANVGLAALLAGFVSNGEGPVRVHDTGIEQRESGVPPKPTPFASAFKTILKGGKTKANAAIAAIAKRAIDLPVPNDTPHPLMGDDAAALAAALTPKTLNKAMRDAWDAKGYFEAVSKAFCVEAVREAVGQEQAGQVARMPKDEAAKFALANVPKTGWLPPALRAECYDGPTGKTKKGK